MKSRVATALLILGAIGAELALSGVQRTELVPFTTVALGPNGPRVSLLVPSGWTPRPAQTDAGRTAVIMAAPDPPSWFPGWVNALIKWEGVPSEYLVVMYPEEMEFAPIRGTVGTPLVTHAAFRERRPGGQFISVYYRRIDDDAFRYSYPRIRASVQVN